MAIRGRVFWTALGLVLGACAGDDDDTVTDCIPVVETPNTPHAAPSTSNCASVPTTTTDSTTDSDADSGTDSGTTIPGVPRLSAGGPGAEVIDPYEEAITLPGCDPADPLVRVIQSDADWADINDPAWRVFCVEPGDYRGLGRIEITTSGEPSAVRVLRYHNPAESGEETHPVAMADNDRAVVQKLRLVDADYWVLDRLAILNNDLEEAEANTTLEIGFGASNNVVQRTLIEGGLVGVQFIRESNENVLQRNVVRDTMLVYKDALCIMLTASGEPDLQITGNRIVSNELYNCTAGVQLHINDGSLGTTFPGTVLANNDAYLTEERYTDCHGNMDPKGNCAAGEFGLVIKGGGTSAAAEDRVTLIRNRIWGWKKSDLTGLASSGSAGTGLVACCYPSPYVLFESNLVTHTGEGMTTAHSDYTTVIDNVIAHTYSDYDGSGEVLYAAGERVEFYRNIFLNGVETGNFVSTDQDFRCNTLIGMQKAASVSDGITVTADYNSYFGVSSPALAGPSDLAFSDPSDTKNEPFCYERRIITGPETHCIDGLQPTHDSPHLDHCDPELGSIPGVGLDDELITDP